MNVLDLSSFAASGVAYGRVDNPQAYHDSKKGIPHCVSKSMLMDFAKNPFKWKYRQDEGIEKVSLGFRFGSLVDCLALTPDQFQNQYLVEEWLPGVNKNGSVSKTKQDDEQAARWAAFADRGGAVLTPGEYAEAQQAVGIFNGYLKTEHGLVLGESFESQVAMYKTLLIEYAPDKPPVPITITGMIDILPHDTDLPIIDMKTTSTPVEDSGLIDRDMARYGYGWQAALYCDLYEAIFGIRRDFMFEFMESVAPYCISEVRMDQEALEHYRGQYMAALRQYAECVATGIYPGAVALPRYYRIPRWELKKEWEGGAA